MDASLTVFEILMHKSKKWLVFPTRRLFDTSLRGTHQNFSLKLIPQKLEGWGYHTEKMHNPNINRF